MVRLDSFYLKFVGQGHTPQFKATDGKCFWLKKSELGKPVSPA